MAILLGRTPAILTWEATRKGVKLLALLNSIGKMFVTCIGNGKKLDKMNKQWTVSLERAQSRR